MATNDKSFQLNVNQANTITVTFQATDATEYTGASLTGQSLITYTYDDAGNPVAWTIADTFSKTAGNTWSINLTAAECNVSESFGVIIVEADEILMEQINIEWQTGVTPAAINGRAAYAARIGIVNGVTIG